eukprot:gnl/MRDRNA2_/MRDRNA2_82322_c0_seq4.p1 gnl/MRDRNA2_/MRDRNA2_82322_c0~~gnl/MRDRNA2_/MRDRNA2_82322_c0_seq4.p1  ORF type:complete len:322 (-),score=29.54 gnl/MRDRNA2_/MRDRNA2_82322_c0_seq4:58-1023(-)
MMNLIVYAALSDITWSLKLQTSSAGDVSPSTQLNATLKQQTSSAEDFAPIDPQKVHIFFINLDKDKDRCQCISSQLQSGVTKAPYPVTRIEAQTPKTMNGTHCERVLNAQRSWNSEPQSRGRRIPTAVETALYCSNYMTWKLFYETSNAEYAIIFEDDIVLRSYTWKRVKNLLNNCDGFDYITVDPYYGEDAEMAEGIGHSSYCKTPPEIVHHKKTFLGKEFEYTTEVRHDEELFEMKGTARTHFQIIRRSAIPHLLEHAHQHGPQVLDQWATSFPHEKVRMSRWSPNVCGQSSHDNSGLAGYGITKGLEGCQKKIQSHIK